MQVRTYGASVPLVFVLHGGPGAPGTVATLARKLGEWFRVLEPMQRRSGEEPLTVPRSGVYPAAFAASESPVLLHGVVDPHPGRLIQASLEPYVRRLEYRDWERCGHYPWAERAAREEFFEVLRSWLTKHIC
jgi:hypothetical protein